MILPRRINIKKLGLLKELIMSKGERAGDSPIGIDVVEGIMSGIFRTHVDMTGVCVNHMLRCVSPTVSGTDICICKVHGKM